jgi:hypothetical protein
MNIRRKPNYRDMKFETYLELVFHAMEQRLGPDGAGLLCYGYNADIVSEMIHDAVRRFSYFNLSPVYTACQIITLLTEKNLERVQ